MNLHPRSAVAPSITGLQRALRWPLLAVGMLAALAVSAQTNAPLIQAGNITYLGAYALPLASSSGSLGGSVFNYGGRGLTAYVDPASGAHSLFMQGHNQKPGMVAQLAVPAANPVNSANQGDLPTMSVLQPFYDVTAPVGADTSGCGAETFVYGLKVFNGRLIVGDACSYGGNGWTGVHGLDLSQATLKGWYGFASGVVAQQRALAGPMIAVPPEWQSLLGGPVLTGNCCISVIGTTSAGPAATVFNPDDVGVSNPIPGKTLLYYDLTHPLCGSNGCESSANPQFNLTTRYGGGAFPAGSRSVLFVMGHGTGCYWYGTYTQNSLGACSSPDPWQTDNKGPHAPPYVYQILAYDANDLLAVKQGTKQPWDLRPYAVIPLNGMPNSADGQVQGASWDQAAQRLYITQSYGDSPRVEVYKIVVPAVTALVPPTNIHVVP